MTNAAGSGMILVAIDEMQIATYQYQKQKSP